MANVEQFPLFRIATLLTQRLSSPISKQLKVWARHHPRFGSWVCARAGRWLRAGELRFKLWVLQLPSPRCPISVSDREAIDIGTDILGEVTIFALGALIIIFEVNRQAENREAKILDKRSHWVAILTALEELKIEVEIQQKEIDLLLAAIRKLGRDVPPPLPATLTQPLHATDHNADPGTPPPILDQHALAALSSVTAPPLSSLPLHKATPDEITPLSHSSPTVALPSSESPAVDQPSSSPPSRCNSAFLFLVNLAEDELF